MQLNRVDKGLTSIIRCAIIPRMIRPKFYLIATVLALCALLMPCEGQSRYSSGGRNSGHSTVIIFIHGYTGSNASWTSTTGAKSLPLLIGSDPDLASFADVYLFQYPTSLADSKAELPPSIANDLLNTVHDLRDHDGKKNVVMVCHSIGGLIAWAMIDQMSTTDYMQRPVKMIFSYGTPYRGTKLSPAPFAAVLSPNKQLYAFLQLGKNSFLDEMLRRYANSETQQHIIDSYCAYETRKMPGIGIVVDKDSATALCNRTKFAILADHVQLARSDSPAYPDNFNDLKFAILESSKKWAH